MAHNRFKELYNSSFEAKMEFREFLKAQTMSWTLQEAVEMAELILNIEELKKANIKK